MAVDLIFVESIDEIAQSLDNFAAGALSHPELARSLIGQTSFWVYDPAAKTFGPSKFVGFRDMDFAKYEVARQGGYIGDRFDGHLTRARIEQVLNAVYVSNPALVVALRRWV